MRGLARPAVVALLAASTLAYEVLLVRVFAIESFHHFATMAIGVAMLGFGFAGTVLALVGELPPPRAERLFQRMVLLTAPSLILSVLLAHLLRVDVTQLPWDPAQWPRLAVVYLLLAMPFAVGAAAVLLGLTLEPERRGLVYGASFIGSGLGSVAVLAALALVSPERALAVPALIAAAAVPIASALPPRHGRRRRRVLGVLLLLLAAGLAAAPPWSLHITAYKALPQVEAYPGARRVAERSSPLGWVVAVDAPPFRHAPGLSLAYRGDFPQQTALFIDAQLADAASRFGATPEATRLLRWLPTAMPYALGAPGRVAVLGAGGGLEVANAVAHGARSVAAVELIPDLAELGRRLGSAPAADTLAAVDWVISDARSWVAGGAGPFELVVVGAGQGFGTAAAGVHALDADFLHTAEAYRDYLGRLAPGGMLAVTRWRTTPPRPGPRLVLTAAEALRRLEPTAVEHGLVVMHGWATTTVLVRPAGFDAAEISRLAAWCAQRRFDLDWHPGGDAPAARFNLLEEPELNQAARAAVAGGAELERFIEGHPFHIAPATDARPYPHHFLRLSSLPGLLAGDRGAWLPFAEWGVVALLATLVQSVLLSLVLLVVPAAAAARRRAPARVGRPRLVAFFAAIGLGYLVAEIAVIQQLTLLLGHPVYSVALALAAFLVASGAGSVLSDRRPEGDGWRSALLVAALLLVFAASALALVHAVHAAALPLRALAAGALLVPPAFLMGMPFPLGLRRLVGDSSGGTAWAWAANGFASVAAAPTAGLLALEAGTGAVFVLAALCYLAAAVLQGLPLPAGRRDW